MSKIFTVHKKLINDDSKHHVSVVRVEVSQDRKHIKNYRKLENLIEDATKEVAKQMRDYYKK